MNYNLPFPLFLRVTIIRTFPLYVFLHTSSIHVSVHPFDVKLIEKIQVKHAEKVDGQMMQEIAIVWRFAGTI